MEAKVQLFSGGFDSMLQEWLIKPDILLYVDMHTSYSEIEKVFLKTLPKYYTDRLVIKDLPIGEFERDNKYLPYRNLLLATIAQEYGQHVYFGFNVDDDAPDKGDDFIFTLTRLFKVLNKNAEGDMGWDNNNFSFNIPFKRYSKTQMVALAMEAGMSVERIQHIRTCYSGVSFKGCGECLPCANKAVALLNNGIYEEDLFDEDVMPILLRRSHNRELSVTQKIDNDNAIKILKSLRK